MGVEADGEHCAGHDLGLPVVLRNGVVNGFSASNDGPPAACWSMTAIAPTTSHWFPVDADVLGVAFGEQALGVRHDRHGAAERRRDR
jgi:hypothetical protein